MRAFRTLAGLAWRADPWRVVGTLVLSQAQGLGMSLLPLFLKFLTDAARSGNRFGVLAAASGIAIAEAIAAVARMASQTMGVRRDENTGRVIDETLMTLSLQIPTLEHHEDPKFRDQLTVLQQRRFMLLSSFQFVVGSVVAWVQIGVTVGLLVSLHPALVLLPLFSLPSMWAAQRGHEYMHKAWDDSAESQRKMAHLFGLATSQSASKELRIFGIKEEIVDRHAREWARIDAIRRKAETREAALVIFGSLMLAVGYLGSIILVASRAAAGDLTAGDMLMALVLAARAQMYVGVVTTVFRSLPELLSLGRRLVWLQDYAAAAFRRNDLGTPVPEQISTGIEFREVCFHYPGSSDLVLSGISFHVSAGSTLAIVGDNGAGKSSLIKLLCQLYAPTSGLIALDGIDLRSFDISDWRSRISVGFQDFARFEFLLRETVGVGDLPRVDDRDAVEAALGRAEASSVPASLAAGLDAQLGRSFRDGVDLSGGEWQKLALGRAMMREEPLLLVLDEPTANLDAQTEYTLFERYALAARQVARVTGGITILVSHRFSTVRMADRIVVLDKGRLAEIGSHGELMATGGLYAEAFSAQARAYS